MRFLHWRLCLFGTFTSTLSSPLLWPRQVVNHTVAPLANSSIVRISFNEADGASAASSMSRGIAALSIEFCYIVDYLGDVGKPNALSKMLLQNIQDISGAPPLIRIGGDTQDVAQYHPNISETINNVFQTGNTEAVSVSFNANLFKVMNENVPSNQKYIFGLNFKQGDVSIPLAEVAGAEVHVDGNRIVAYELGNEPEYYPSTWRSPPWNIQTYAQQQVSWLPEIRSKIMHPEIGFQLGAISEEPIYMGNFSQVELVKLGVPAAVGNVTRLSDHTYPFSVCNSESAAEVSLTNLMNHMNTIQYFSQWSTEIAAASLAGAKFVMGETGSVSCHGQNGVSNTFGAALWEIDYMLHGSTLGMDAVHFHAGTPFYYSMWQPVAYNNTPAKVYPTYYSLLFMASAIVDVPNPNIYELLGLEDENLALYALYNGDSLQKILALNLEIYDATSSTRPQVTLNISEVLDYDVKVSRLTAPSTIITSTENVTWMGQTYSTGSALGDQQNEISQNGLVVIQASEAVIIERSH